ncbi:MAG: FecR domain-containing protein [Leptospiraceae bacterium]|nr:FecR domain-containing protein [Leptospiraceae bacterium]
MNLRVYPLYLISLLLFCSPSGGQRPLDGPGTDGELSGVFLFTVGQVTLDGNPAGTGTLLESGQTIATGPSSICDIQIRKTGSNAIIRLQANSELVFQIRDYSRQAELQARIRKGEALFDIEKIPPQESVKVYASTTVASVRGTRFAVRSEGPAIVQLYQGSLEVRPRVAQLEDLPQDFLERSGSARTLLEEAKKQTVILEPGDAVQINAIQPAEPLAREILEIQSRLEPDMRNDRMLTLIDQFDEATETIVNQEDKGLKQSPPLRKEKMNKEEMEQKVKEYEDLIRLEKEKLDSETVGKAAQERNQKHQVKLMQKIERIFNKPSETLVLVSGQRISGVVIQSGDIYFVYTVNGQLSFPRNQVEGVEF